MTFPHQVDGPDPTVQPHIWQQRWITDGAWICGLVGAMTVLFCGFWFSATGTLQTGIFLFGRQWTDNPVDSALSALVLCAGMMVSVELLRLYRRDRHVFFRLDPDLQSGYLWRFLRGSLANYFSYLALFTLVIAFYQAANEYGFNRSSTFYEPWFRFLDIAWLCYLWGGLPYVLLTRAIRHDPQADQRDPAELFRRLCLWCAGALSRRKKQRAEFTESDKKIALGLLIKIFFAPLMTIFFCEQFQYLVNNFHYLSNALPALIHAGQYNHSLFNRDMFGAASSMVFSIDVALAWCGYITASRWLDNQIASAEPTLAGWLVCVLCYPPLQQIPGLYFSIPSDQAMLSIQHPWLVSLFTLLIIASYLVYMSATLFFGVRFSNLTNRGIIRRGPFAWVRHPAYASKNIAWWFVMFPFVIYSIPTTGIGAAIFATLSLIAMTGLYYLRALTEERHLLSDPCYQEYCRQVKYRFIPGLL